MTSQPIESSSPHPKTSRSHSPLLDPSKKTPWPKKVENYLRTGQTKSNSNLTEENLKELNRINEILYDHRRSFTSTSKSPYYKGLTDSSLILNRQKLSGPSSPGTESDVVSVASSSISSFIVKMKERSPCFSASQVKDTFVPSGKRHQKQEQTPNETTLTTLGKEMSIECKLMGVNTTISQDLLLLRKKPLRESNSNTKSPSPQKPKPSSPPQQRLNAHAVSPSPLKNHLPPPPPAKPPVSTPPWAHLSPSSRPPGSVPQYAQAPILSVSLQPIVQLSPQEPPPPVKAEQKTPPPPPPSTTTQSKQQVSSPSPLPKTSSQILLPPTPQPQGSPTNKTKEDSSNKITQGKMYVFADRYRPEALKDFICNRDKARELQTMVKSGDCGHFVFEGLTGVGKRTMIWALLREAFGPDRVQTREEVKQFTLQGEAVGSIKVTVKMSLQHIEIRLSEVKGYEKHVIIELIQETVTRSSTKTLHCNKENCRVIILYDADKLSTDALSYIKWQLERQPGCNKVFFCCTDASKLQPIIPLCTVVKLLPPSNEEIIDVLEYIAEQEGIELPHKMAMRIANNSKNNLRQAIRSFEATWDHKGTLKEDQMILTGWEDDILNIAKSIVEEQSPRQLYNVRGKLQNLIEHNVCSEFIFEGLIEELKNCSVEEFHPQINTLYKKYKIIAPHIHPARKNLQHYMTIEEFIAKFMSCYKTSIKNKHK